MKKVNSRSKIKTGITPIIVIALIIILLVLLFLNFVPSKVSISDKDRALVIGKNNLFAVYEDKLSVKIPKEISINNEETIGDLVNTKNYEKVLEKINSVLPEKLEKYIVAGNDELENNFQNMKNIPEINIGNKRHILTSSVNSLFDEMYNKTVDTNVLNENILVDVLNANGKGGYARKTGEMIKEKFGMKYNAANYETEQQESYIIVNDISKSKVEDIIEILPEKYFKIKKSSSIPTLANLVIVLGKEEKINTSIEIFSKEDSKDEIDILRKAGYKNIKTSKSGEDITKDAVFYSPEDYYTAYKIAKKLNVTNLLEKEDLKDKIEVYLD